MHQSFCTRSNSFQSDQHQRATIAASCVGLDGMAHEMPKSASAADSSSAARKYAALQTWRRVTPGTSASSVSRDSALLDAERIFHSNRFNLRSCEYFGSILPDSNFDSEDEIEAAKTQWPSPASTSWLQTEHWVSRSGLLWPLATADHQVL